MNDLRAEVSGRLDYSRAANEHTYTAYFVQRLFTVAVVLVGLVYFALIPYVESKVFKTEVEVTEIALVSPAQGSIELTSTGYVKPLEAVY